MAHLYFCLKPNPPHQHPHNQSKERQWENEWHKIASNSVSKQLDRSLREREREKKGEKKGGEIEREKEGERDTYIKELCYTHQRLNTFDVWASSTSFTIWANMVSEPMWVASITNTPFWLREPPMTWSPVGNQSTIKNAHKSLHVHIQSSWFPVLQSLRT